MERSEPVSAVTSNQGWFVQKLDEALSYTACGSQYSYGDLLGT